MLVLTPVAVTLSRYCCACVSAQPSRRKPIKVPTVMGVRMAGHATPAQVRSAAAAEAEHLVRKMREGEIKMSEPVRNIPKAKTVGE